MTQFDANSSLSERKSINDYFQKPSEFANLLEPLVKALEWTGTYRNLIEVLPHFSEQLDLTGFRNVLVRLRYKSEPVKVKLSDVDKRLLPALFVPTDAESFLILDKIDDTLEVINGLNGKKQRIRSESEGILFVFTLIDTTNEPKQRKSWFLGHYTRYKPLTSQVMLVSYILNIFILSSPIYVKYVYDWIIATKSIPMLVEITLGVAVILAAADVLGAMRTRILAHVAARLDKSVNSAIMERIFYLPPAFTENASVGSQIARIRDFDMIRDFFTSPMATMVYELPFMVIFLLIIWLLTGWLVYVPMVMLAIFGSVYFWFNPRMQEYLVKSAELGLKKHSFQLETLSSFREIKSTSSQEVWIERYASLTGDVTKNGFYASMISMALNTLSETFMMASGLLVLGLGAVLVLSEQITTGALVAAMMLTWRTLAPMKMLFSIMPRVKQIFNNIKKIDALMDLPLERDPDKLVTPIRKKHGQVVFNRVSFRYRGDLPPALLGVSFKVEPRQLVCVAGRNGSGKSTLIKLIPAMYAPQAGSVEIDGSNIQQMDRIELRHAIGYMPQQTKLFYGTLEQNLLFGNPIATKEQMIWATKLACIYDIIMALPKGFQTHIEDQSAATLSASFQQKLAMARTYIRQASIMLFDEPANTLDEQGDKEFMAAMLELKKVSTIFVVTHRPSHLKVADRILYMNQGELVLNGPPAEILPKIPFDYL